MRGVPTSAHARLTVSLVVGVVVLLAVGLSSSLLLGALSGIAGMGAVFVLAGLVVLWPMTAERTRHNARREDYRPDAEELLVVAAALVGLVVIVVLLVLGNPATRNAAAAIGLVGLFLAWATLHLMYTARYAYLHYEEPVGGIDFNSSEQLDRLPRVSLLRDDLLFAMVPPASLSTRRWSTHTRSGRFDPAEADSIATGIGSFGLSPTGSDGGTSSVP